MGFRDASEVSFADYGEEERHIWASAMEKAGQPIVGAITDEELAALESEHLPRTMLIVNSLINDYVVSWNWATGQALWYYRQGVYSEENVDTMFWGAGRAKARTQLVRKLLGLTAEAIAGWGLKAEIEEFDERPDDIGAIPEDGKEHENELSLAQRAEIALAILQTKRANGIDEAIALMRGEIDDEHN